MSRDSAKPEEVDEDRYQRALQFLYDRINYEKLVDGASRFPFRLKRIADLIDRLGLSHFLDPTCVTSVSGAIGSAVPVTPPGRVTERVIDSIPLIHIAGTKGKGSTATMVSAALTAAGIRTGTYTSPHLHSLEERFRVDGKPCSARELIELVECVREAAEQMANESVGSPTFFELTTAISLLHFHRSDCQVVVIEVGLGGRLDCTNVCRPTVSVITSIGLDHQHVLGDTKEAIAAEKAGIIKDGVPVISGVTESGPAEVIERISREHSAPLYQLGRDFAVTDERCDDWGSIVNFDGRDCFEDLNQAQLSLEGTHQARNASLAIAVLQTFQRQTSIEVPQDAIRTAMMRLRCDGRLDRYRLPREVTVIVDAAHNEDSVTALCQAVQRRQYKKPIAFVFGTSVDKSAEPMLRLIGDLANSITLTQFSGNPRFCPVESLQKRMPDGYSGELFIQPDAMQACRTALDKVPDAGTLIVCGSFFLAAEVRGYFESLQISPKR
ncbi:bifunctional folylpolyglutamate synthase/dihydrofolate synthase [Rubripirellula amarantea]|uniref:bifunctional folylpolyglutamate synthase/dihydrofolate synthase n=1 Tax=Rubripirellula amarantea TaxID=2527999 RepID=UPI0013EF4684|nr:folylpolyglutamate synthase/dihydrofolate synthase family protein [Rubripirellula amarantea]